MAEQDFEPYKDIYILYQNTTFAFYKPGCLIWAVFYYCNDKIPKDNKITLELNFESYMGIYGCYTILHHCDWIDWIKKNYIFFIKNACNFVASIV